tara:strand:+ start:263 stop:661 length:399 start_codon:yes stop_codon:yes gene_type:complete
MFRPLITFALAAISVAGAAHAQSFHVKNPSTVTPVSNNSFAVAAGGEFGSRGTWCSAANYALTTLRLPGTTRLYVLKASSPVTGQVLFGTDPGGLQPQSVLSVAASLKSPGSNLSANQAFTYCSDLRLKYRR